SIVLDVYGWGSERHSVRSGFARQVLARGGTRPGAPIVSTGGPGTPRLELAAGLPPRLLLARRAPEEGPLVAAP
ncbi:MAG TPA: hypothetical protein VG073_03985, partial [Gaiellaceae bacterium]|nr:hypothetical protein [Gaiellaceae bacterium]